MPKNSYHSRSITSTIGFKIGMPLVNKPWVISPL